MKVIYIVGKGRSGSTLLDNVLNQIPGVFSTGELWRRWGRRPMEAYRCGCGEPVADCPVWSNVLDLAYRRTSNDIGKLVDSAEVLAWEEELWSLGVHFRLIQAGLMKWPLEEDLRRLSILAKHVYFSIREVTDCQVVVDSSKWPLFPGALGLTEHIEPRLVHLVRDSRAVAYSWTKKKMFLPGERPMPTYSTLYSIMSWWYRNALAELATRIVGREACVRIRYEDFVDRPEVTLRRILSLVGLERSDLPLVGGRIVRMGANHTMWGNKSRFRKGDVPLRRDDRWRREQSGFARWMTTMLTGPLLLRYGYIGSR